MIRLKINLKKRINHLLYAITLNQQEQSKQNKTKKTKETESK